MSKPARGTKRVCLSCGARFFDLKRSPIVCAVCQSVYPVTPPTPRRAAAAAPVKPAETQEPPTESVAAAVAGAEVISLEEAQSLEQAEPADEAAAAEEIGNLGGDDAEIPADDDDTFLEQEEEDEKADVSGIVSSPNKEDT